MNKLFAAWTRQVLEYQRQYQDAWQALSMQMNAPGQHGGTAANASANPWIAALEQWCQTMQPSATGPAHDFYARLIEQGKTYLQVTDGLHQAFQQAAAAGESVVRWQEAMNDTMTGLKEMFGGNRAGVPGAAHQAIAFWELPLNTWQRAVSSSSILPGDFLQNVGGASGVGQVRDQIHGRVDQLLSTPAIGYMREHQEQSQILAKLSLDYQQALQDYAATYGEIGVRCVETLQQAIRQRTAEENPIRSLRELYDLWIDSCEQAYGEYVKTDRYVEIYGRLVNSLMALKRHGSMMVDEVLGAMNMPTRAEVDTLHRRLQESRRESKALHSEVVALRRLVQAEIGALKKRLGTGDGQSASANGSEAKAATNRKTASGSVAAKSSTKANSRAKQRRPSVNRS